MLSGLLVGFLVGFIMKRSRYCISGSLRDLYLEKNIRGLINLLFIISIGGCIYFSFVLFKLIPPTEYRPFSILATVLGSFSFGFGTILANGCITASLIKTGDGRIAGLTSLTSFIIFATSTKQGILQQPIQHLQSLLIVSDHTSTQINTIGLVMMTTGLLILCFWAYRHPFKPKYSLPKQYSGLRYLFFEKIWSQQTAAILMGILAGSSWWLSSQTGRNGSWGITTPLISWFNLITNLVFELNWGSYFVVGIILGSLICTIGSFEFSFKSTDGKTLINSIIGGMLMGIGAVCAKGCLVGNGLIGTATLSMHAWLGLICIILGIWFGAFIYYVKPNTIK